MVRNTLGRKALFLVAAGLVTVGVFAGESRAATRAQAAETGIEAQLLSMRAWGYTPAAANAAAVQMELAGWTRASGIRFDPFAGVYFVIMVQ